MKLLKEITLLLTRQLYRLIYLFNCAPMRYWHKCVNLLVFHGLTLPCGQWRRIHAPRIYLTITIAKLVSLFIPGLAVAFYDQALTSLTDGEQYRLQDYQGKILLVSVFEPECSWCYKQMKVFNRITRECNGHLQPLAVGIHGQKLALRKEVRRVQAQFPTLQASPSWLKTVGEIPATPWNLVIDEQGELVAKVRGYVEFEKIKKAFPQLCSDEVSY